MLLNPPKILKPLNFPSLSFPFPPTKHPHSTTTTTTTITAASTPMEVEVKLRLRDATCHRKLTTLLSPHHIKTLTQQNLFFDTATSPQTLTTNLAALRLRFDSLSTAPATTQSTLSLKSKPSLSGGISRIEELETRVGLEIARSCMENPRRLGILLKETSVMEKVRSEFGVLESEEWICLGGFRNVRQVLDWNGLKLEVDETVFDFGTCYEVECESSEAERDKGLIEKLLVDNGIEFCYSSDNKFAVFRSGKLPPWKGD